MRCEICDTPRCQVKDSRSIDQGTRRRRRYECQKGHRFTTFETYGSDPVWLSDNLIQLLLSKADELPQLIRDEVKLIEDKRAK